MAATGPKSFATDGAAGSAGGSAGTANLGNGQPNIPATWMANGALNGFGGQYTQEPASNDPVGSQAWNSEHSGNPIDLMFDDGGTVPDTNDGPDPSSGMSGTGDRIALALATVDSALSYGRKLNGLPSDGDDTESNTAAPGGQQVAMGARMPSVPGTQSNSGAKPIQPMPGPLPPTSNPFGKRTMGANEPGDGGDDATPTIPTDDDEEAA
jgi:hypothetical protein